MKKVMQHALVTGGAGLVGSHLCDLLLKKGYAVTVVDNFVTGHPDNLKDARLSEHFDFLQQDVCEPIDETKLKLFQLHGLHAVFHFACPASPIDFAKIPIEILKVDSLGTIHTVDLALRHKARFVLASTSEVYGDPLVHPQTEDYWGNVNTVGPRSCYDETKRFAEAYTSTSAWHSGLDLRIVRIFNTYGPRMRPSDGRVVPELCMQALQGRPLTLHGDGKQTRSFCYVSDLVDGIVRLFEGPVTGPVNIGNPVEKTMLEFAQAIQTLMGSKLELKYLPARTDDPRRRCPDITRARTLLGWEPRVGLEAGLKLTLDYFRTQL